MESGRKATARFGKIGLTADRSREARKRVRGAAEPAQRRSDEVVKPRLLRIRGERSLGGVDRPIELTLLAPCHRQIVLRIGIGGIALQKALVATNRLFEGTLPVQSKSLLQ
jgi:hypothetical protein